MKLYTLDDAFRDFWQIEGFEFNEDSPSFDDLRKIRFVKPYGEYVTLCESQRTANSPEEKTERFEGYLNSVFLNLPWCDIDPVEDKRFSVYQFLKKDKMSENKLFLMGTTDSKEDALKMFELIDHTKYTCVAVVDTVERWALYFQRNNIQ